MESRTVVAWNQSPGWGRMVDGLYRGMKEISGALLVLDLDCSGDLGERNYQNSLNYTLNKVNFF